MYLLLAFVFIKMNGMTAYNIYGIYKFVSRSDSTAIIVVRGKMKTNQFYIFDYDALVRNFDSDLYMRHILHSDSSGDMDSDSNHHSSRDILSKSNWRRKHNWLDTFLH